MADEKLNTGPAENTSPEAAEPITTPEQAAASEPQQEQTGPAIPESGDVVVSFDKINELMAEKRQNARAEVEKAEPPETPEAAAPGETPQPANTEEPKKPRRGCPPKAEKAATENQKAEKSAGARKGRPPKADTKPFSMPILLRKIAAVLRRSKRGEDEKPQIITYGNLLLNCDSYAATVDGSDFELTQKEFEILRELLTHQGRILTRQNLLDKLWRFDFYGDERVVDTHIKNLRKKLGIDFIQTIRGVGYKVDKEN